MTDLNPNPTSGAGGTSGGATSGNPDTKPDTVTRSAYEDAVTEAKRAKERAAAADAELQRFRDAERVKAEQEALARGEHEKVIAAKEREIAELKAKDEANESERIRARKLVAFNKGLGSQLESRWFHLVDLDGIKANADGTPNAEAVAKAVESFKATYPECVGKGAGSGIPPGPKPGETGGGIITDEMYAAMSLEEKRKNMKAYTEQISRSKK
jgi:hypothetical protein